jgi:RNA polymerase sigma-70 factor (ECF subfamily)
MDTTSQTLLRKLRDPDQSAAWDRFVRLYSPGLYSWACGMGLKEDDAADLVQDVLLTLIKTLPEFEYDPGKRFRGWLWTVTKNQFLKRSNRRSSATVDPNILDQRENKPEEPFWEEEYRKHMFSRIAMMLEKDFPAPTWRAFWAHVVEGKPASQVSAELGINFWAVYTAKVRVLAHLHKELAEFAPI